MTGRPLAIYHRLRLCLWWLRGGRHLAVIASGTVLVVVLLLTITAWIHNSSSKDPLSLPPLGPNLVDLTLVRNATEKGALCLDGSRPGYHLQRGFGSGADKWVLHIEGGGWCNTAASCSFRAGTPLGSSHYMGLQTSFVGILSQTPSQNPDFYNWNRVKIRYCDGASFSGETEIQAKNGRKLYFSGQQIWEAVMSELLTEGLTKAKQAFLTGCSAGGLATFIHCDSFRELMPKEADVKCLADAGFFLDEMDISGKRTMKSFYNEVVRLQIQHILVPESSDREGHWLRCKKNIRDCDPNQIEVLQGYRKSMLRTLSEFQQKKDAGIFINSCYIHCQTMSNITWHSPTSPRINNKTIAEAVGDWYFGRREVKDIDCPYPCNPTCYHMNFN